MEILVEECRYCGSERKNKNSKTQHERLCSNNPERAEPTRGMLGKKGANQFTKNENYTVSPETREKLSESNRKRKLTPETRAKISEARRAFLAANPDKVPYLLNHKSKGPSYPEKYFREFLEAHGVTFEEQKPVLAYRLDFAISKSKVDLEIDGDQHHLDPRIATHDILRTQRLSGEGWRTVRVRWSAFQKLSKLEKDFYLKNLLVEISR